MAGKPHPPIMEDAERMLGTMARPSAIEKALCTQHGIAPRTARRYMEYVRRRWRTEGVDAGHEDRSERKAQIRRAVQEQHQSSLNAYEVARKAENPSAMASASRSAQAALKLLAELDGLVTSETTQPSTQVAIVNQVPAKTEQETHIVQEGTGKPHSPDALRRRIDELVALKVKQLQGPR